MHAMRRLAAIAATTGLSLAVTAPAEAAKSPTAAQRSAIAEAAGIPSTCLTIKVSTARSGWAAYTFRDKKSTRKQCAMHASNGFTITQRSGKSWRQRWAGSDCPKRVPKRVPQAVWRDLARTYCGS